MAGTLADQSPVSLFPTWIRLSTTAGSIICPAHKLPCMKLLGATLPLMCFSMVLAQTTTTPHAQNQQKAPTVKQQVEVTATRLPEDPENVPTPIEVFTGEELSARGAHDLRTAMASAIGVEIAPGGDSGPAGSVPAFWG